MNRYTAPLEEILPELLEVPPIQEGPHKWPIKYWVDWETSRRWWNSNSNSAHEGYAITLGIDWEHIRGSRLSVVFYRAITENPEAIIKLNEIKKAMNE